MWCCWFSYINCVFNSKTPKKNTNNTTDGNNTEYINETYGIVDLDKVLKNQVNDEYLKPVVKNNNDISDVENVNPIYDMGDNTGEINQPIYDMGDNTGEVIEDPHLMETHDYLKVHPLYVKGGETTK